MASFAYRLKLYYKMYIFEKKNYSILTENK